MALFLCPKGHWLIRAMRGTGKAAPVALHGEGGYSLSRKRVSPLNPREKGRGVFPLDPAALAVLGLKSYAACGLHSRWQLCCLTDVAYPLRVIGCGVRGFATGLCESLPISTAPYSREARVTIARRRTACWRHCCAHRGTGAKNDRVSGRFLLWESHRAPVRKLRCGA